MKNNCIRTALAAVFTVAIAGLANHALGVPVLYYNHYTQPSDAPSGFYSGGAAQHIEDMEAGSLRFGISANTGQIIPPPPGLMGYIDSVPTDGNQSDALGFRGHSWYANGDPGVIFRFDVAHTAAGLVWTDGVGLIYAEFFRGSTSLGVIGPLDIADASVSGTIGEDTFLGATDPLGITSIHVWGTVYSGMEVDHVQFGDMAVPSVPDTGNSLALLGFACAGLTWFKRRLA